MAHNDQAWNVFFLALNGIFLFDAIFLEVRIIYDYFNSSKEKKKYCKTADKISI